MQRRLFDHEIVYMRDVQDMTWGEIAEIDGRSPQRMMQIYRKYKDSPITTIKENFPWKVPATKDVWSHPVAKGMRYHGYAMIGEDLTEDAAKRRQQFLERIDYLNHVVDYGPQYGGIPGWTSKPGFALLPREESDEGYIIKMRAGIRLTDLGEKIWRLPPSV